MNRRSLLTVGSTAFVTTVAGCLGGDDDGAEEDDGGNGGDSGNGEVERSDEDTLLSISDISELDELPFDADVIAEFDGEGSAVTDEFSLDSGLTMLVYQSENVDDEGIGADVEQTDGDDSHTLAINEVVFMGDDIDEVTGASLVEAAGGEYLIDIDTDGEWAVHVVQPRAPDEEIRTLPVSATGEDSAVVGPIDVDNGMTVIGEHTSGDEEYSFNVRAVPEDATGPLDGDYAFTEDAGFEGEARVDVDGITWISVGTRGEWTLKFEE